LLENLFLVLRSRSQKSPK